MLEVFIGSGLGGVVRYLFGLLSVKIFNDSWPGTMLVNVLGSCAIVFVFQKSLIHDDRLNKVLIIGFLGGFTTFSSFSLEVFTKINQGHLSQAILILLLNILLGVIMGIFIFR